MTKILCAIRGGEASYETQDAAIALAKEKEADLLFIYVVDTRFMDKTARAIRRDTVTREMGHMGEFLLMMALERAKEQGVKSSLLIRHGGFRAELMEAAKEQGAEIVVLGAPGGEEAFFSQDDIKTFAQRIESETQARVVFADTASQ